jgi:hypothetical protein
LIVAVAPGSDELSRRSRLWVPETRLTSCHLLIFVEETERSRRRTRVVLLVWCCGSELLRRMRPAPLDSTRVAARSTAVLDFLASREVTRFGLLD